MTTRGVVIVAYGDRARAQAAEAYNALRLVHPGLTVLLTGDPATLGVLAAGETFVVDPTLELETNVQRSRWAKVNLGALDLFDCTLYLDADTRVQGSLDPLFAVLESGWDMVITPSQHQGDQWMRHVGPEERDATLQELGYRSELSDRPVSLQAGVFGYRQSDRIRAFFAAWQEEWLRWRDQDQAAFLRALHRVPLKVYLLGRAFNGGEVIEHLFGAAR